MDEYRRIAIYYTPQPGAFANFAASVLGWDNHHGRPVSQPIIAGLDLPEITRVPRKYGFHATLKAPFRLRENTNLDTVIAAVDALATRLSSVALPNLHLVQIGQFIAFAPGDSGPSDLAGDVVRALEPFRARLSEAEIARRNPEALTKRQRMLLRHFGYPYVFDEFRFHMTITGPVDQPADVLALLRKLPWPAAPDRLDALSVMGEDADGMFRLIRRVSL